MDHVNRKTEEAVIPALLSRCQVYVLNAFTRDNALCNTDSFSLKNIELRKQKRYCDFLVVMDASY
jgi:replication-associated recombination protein RarA